MKPLAAGSVTSKAVITVTLRAVTVNDSDGALGYAGGDWVHSTGRGKGDYGDDVHATTVNDA